MLQYYPKFTLCALTAGLRKVGLLRRLEMYALYQTVGLEDLLNSYLPV